MSNVDERLAVGPGHMEAGVLAEPIAAYAAHLSGLGYTALTIKGYTDSARHLGAWLALSGLAISALTGMSEGATTIQPCPSSVIW